ncbi:hypothetical protein E2P81_ATG00941 [Venturia nashicola]|uniref:Uncharacterized protein n=1 Tax=Venturia nashicola TaxID=86259 RepID=A0A4Z1PU18_9PEZI|nr:hypothetical protein E6O75_ATG00962 [Venturia nashicola]TLD38398.1 hypothetical protein E2P81_ATG00941 [Venturia nashicola]
MEYQYQPEHHQRSEYRRAQSNNYPTPPRSSSPKNDESFAPAAPAALPTPSETESFIPPQPSYSKSNLEAYQNGHHQYYPHEQHSEYPPQKPVYYNELAQYHAKGREGQGRDTEEQHSTSTPQRSSSYNELTHYHAKSRDPQGQSSTSTPRTPSYNIHTLGIEDEQHTTHSRKASHPPSRLGIDDGYASTHSRKVSQPSSRPYSPLHRSRTPLSPYNTSRARPRPGFLKRISTRCKTLVKWIVSLGKRHPILFGLATFLPVMAIAVGVKVARNIGRLFGGIRKFSAGGTFIEPFADFKGLAGAKSELHGVLKVVHMYANHWCKVSPSPWPRTLSMLLEIFFMEHKKF